MSTNYPGSLDSYSTKVDGVDDVLAAHVNDPQDAIIAIETQHQQRSLLKIKNGAGATVAAGNVGYINEAGNFVRTTTANLNAAWAVVIVGGADNAQIVVARRGRVTVTLDANCSIGDYLYTSTTAGQAAPLTYVRPEVLAVALTANAGGAGGTCEALLLTGRTRFSETSGNDIQKILGSSDSDWASTLNGAPAGAVITYNVALTSGSEDAIVPDSTGEVAKTVLWNTSKTPDESALIEDVDTGANTITVTAAADIAGWLDTEVIVARSQTNTTQSGGAYFFDLEIEDASVIPILATELGIYITFVDSGAADEKVIFHPWEANATAKRGNFKTQVANISLALSAIPVQLINRRFCLMRTASGAGTLNCTLRLFHIVVATP